MNHRNVKRVKDPKACASCANCVKELNGARPTTYRCSVTPIVAGDKACQQATPRKEPFKEKSFKDVQEYVEPFLTTACNYLQDIQDINGDLTFDSVMLMLSAALKNIKDIAKILEVNVEK